MNRDKLSSIFSENKNAYAKLLKQAGHSAVEERWAMGVLPPLTLEPYEIELLGYKRDKFLKKTSTPAKNRFKYLFDKAQRMVYLASYSEMVGKDEWLHGDEIFVYDVAGAFQYKFGSVSGHGSDADLQKVAYVLMADGKIQKSYTVWDDNNYAETDYHHKDSDIVEIKMRLWYRTYIERNFKVSHEGGSVSIVEATNGKIHKVFPPE